MGNMREIRDRIKSINDIMKITNAMYLISSSKLKKAKKDLAATQPYFNKLLYAMRSILSRAPEDIDMRYFDQTGGDQARRPEGGLYCHHCGQRHVRLL